MQQHSKYPKICPNYVNCQILFPGQISASTVKVGVQHINTRESISDHFRFGGLDTGLFAGCSQRYIQWNICILYDCSDGSIHIG